MIDVSDEIKQAYDVSTTQIDKIIVNEQEYRISNVEYYDDVYSEGNIFGTAIAKCLEFEIENVVNLEGQEVEYQTGIIIDGVTQWISLGNFIIQDVEPNDTTKIAKVTAMDYMLKTNILYESALNYGDGTVTLLDVLQEVCTNSEITLATMEFANSTFIVNSNQFTEGTLNRQVIQAVAQISGTVAKIRNNQLYLITPSTTVSKVFTLNNYEEVEIKRATHPINLVSLGMADVEGENVVLRDESSITANGENSLVINDNPFAYTQAKKEQLITALFNAVKGFEYKAFSFKCQGLPYLETMDKVQFLDKEGNTYDSFIFRFNYKSPNGLESTIEAPSITKATVAYQNVLDALEISKRTEILVDKQNQTIQSVVSQTDAQNQKIAQVTQTIDELNSKIGDIADITTSKETINGTVTIEKVNQSEPIYVKIYPTGVNISYLYPRENLYPSETLFMTVRTLRFINTTTNEYVDYELPTDLLYYDAENYDEFILDYDAQTCVVNKKVGYNADGTTYVLDKPETIEYEYPRIELTDGDYTITLLGYHNAYMLVRLMAQNIYTTQFATKAEVNSEISQTTEKINLSVDKKLTSYPTTTQMNSAISVKANEITSSVSETYETKSNATTNYSKLTQTATSLQSQITSNDTDISTIKQSVNEVNIEVGKKYNTSDFTNAKITAKLNDGTSSVQISADKIDLSATDILNLLAGNEINLTSKNIILKSINFNVDKNGNLTCNNATINNTKVIGGNISLTGGTSNSPNFLIKSSDGTNQAYLTPSQISVGDGSTYFEYSDGVLNIGASGGGNIQLAQGSNRQNSHFNMFVGDAYVVQGNMHALQFLYDSLESLKKNIAPFSESALELLKNIDIYEYNFKSEEDNEKKHIGFVIGDKYKYTKRVTGKDNTGVDNYAYTSLCVKAIQEQQELIEQLQKEIKQLKGEN